MIDLSKVTNYYIACGYTDLRRGIDGLAGIVQLQYGMDLREDSLFKMLYLAMMDITKKWTGRPQDLGRIYSNLGIYFEDRMPRPLKISCKRQASTV